MHIPDSIQVQLKAETPIPGGLSDILVSLDIRYDGRYYYGSLVGLTNDEGFASVAGSEITRRFVDDRRTFLMDYKVPLENCDDIMQVHIEGGRTFQEALKDAANALVKPWARDLWSRARNSAVRASAVSMDSRQPGIVTVPVRAA